MTPTAKPVGPVSRRTPLIDALRALAVLVILLHHFARFGPLCDWVSPIAGGVIHFFAHYGRATQIFFVVGGYVLARSLSKRTWNVRRVGRFVVHRYLRLGFPYLGAIALAIAACRLGRGWLPSDVVGPPVTWQQLLAHLFFLQEILGYESLSAGLWFVCINFQLSLVFVAIVWLRDYVAGTLRVPSADSTPHAPREAGHHAERDEYYSRQEGSYGLLVSLIGWSLAIASLFYFNLDDRWDMWFIYFFAHFYLGVVIHAALSEPRRQYMFWLYVAMVAVALAVSWRWRLVTTLTCGLLLFAGGKLGFMETWPRSRIISYLGRMSYSLFLVHFPVLVVVATIWTWLGWTGPWQAAAGLAAAFVLSLVVSDLFYRAVENPSNRLSRRVKY